MERPARVLAIEATQMIVAVETAPACSQCGSRKACHRSGTEQTLSLPLQPGLRAGDTVLLGMPTGRLNQAALLAWLLPVLALMLGATLGQLLDGHDIGAIIGAAAGLAVGLTTARVCAARMVAGHFEPCVEHNFQSPTRSPNP